MGSPRRGCGNSNDGIFGFKHGLVGRRDRPPYFFRLAFCRFLSLGLPLRAGAVLRGLSLELA